MPTKPAKIRVLSDAGYSRGDSLAPAWRERLPILTADQSWAKLDLGVASRVVR